jgi:ATPase family associated with various cellular activities (AAA)
MDQSRLALATAADLIAPTGMGGNDPLTDEIVGQLLQELDGIQSRDSEVFLLAATNHAEQIDRAVLSRFQERRIALSLVLSAANVVIIGRPFAAPQARQYFRWSSRSLHFRL